MPKHFILNNSIIELPKEAIDHSRQEAELISLSADIEKEKRAKKQFEEDDNLIHTEGRIVVKVDMLSKNSHRFQDGTEIRIERQYNNFNRRHTEPVNAIVISGENIPKGSMILVSHNALHETNRINDYKNSFETEDSHQIRYFSLPDYECFAWKDSDGRWHPTKDFQFGVRVYKPYKGMLTGIDPEVMEDILFVTTGELANNVCHTLKSCDYEICFQGKDGREKSLIRFRHSDTEELEREELIAVNHELTEKVINGELLIGYSISNCKQFEINAYAD